MVETNWDLLKFKYEVLEYTLEHLATESGLSIPLLEHAAQEWEQVPLEERKANTDLEGDIRSDVVEQSRIFSLLKQKFLNPKYIELETTLLHKAIEAAGNIDTSSPGSAKTIQMLTSTLSDLLTEQRALLGDPSAGSETKTWEINIVDSGTENGKTTPVKRAKKVSTLPNHQKAL